MLEAKDVSYSIGKKWLVQNVSYRFDAGKCYMLCGPNGAGKSTLIKMLSLDLTPTNGEIWYNGKLVNSKKKEQYAKCRAVLSQNIDISFPMNVEEIVMMGRYPHFDVRPSKKDFAICEEVMEAIGVTDFRKRNYLTLSGGEKQRVQFARVLVQIWQPPTEGCRFLLLDEPISALDLKYQFDFLQQVKKIIDDKTVVIAILHDLNLAMNYGDEILLLSQSELFASGTPRQVLEPKNIKSVFHVDSQLHHLEGIDLLWVK